MRRAVCEPGGVAIRIVVVEDFAALRALIVQGLETDGRFEVVGEGETGEDAIALVRDLQPDAILLDMHLPLLDGPDALPELQTAAPGTKVVFCSGTIPEQWEHLGVPIVEKTMRLDDLLSGIAGALGLEPA